MVHIRYSTSASDADEKQHKCIMCKSYLTYGSQTSPTKVEHEVK